MRNKKTIALAILAVLLVAVIIGAIVHARNKGQAAPAGARGRQALPVQVLEVQSGDISSVNTLTGILAANMQTSVGSKVSGRVQSVYVNMGDQVHAGQVLAQLDTTDLDKQLAQYQAQVQVDQNQLQIYRNNSEQSQADYQRSKSLFDSGAISQQQLEQVRLKMQNDQAQMQVTQASMNKDMALVEVYAQQKREMSVTSPVDGVVATKNIEPGMQVSTQTALFNIVQADPLKATVNVTDQIMADVHPGIEAQITVPQLGSKVFGGTVVRVSPVTDPVSRAYPVEIQISNPDKQMLPGMAVSVQLVGLKSQTGIAIPAQAVVETTQGSEVFTVEKNVAHMHIVKLGAVSSDKIVILEGLKPGDKVIVNGQTLVSDGAPVTVVDDPDQAGVKGMINQIKKGAGQ